MCVCVCAFACIKLDFIAFTRTLNGLRVCVRRGSLEGNLLFARYKSRNTDQADNAQQIKLGTLKFMRNRSEIYIYIYIILLRLNIMT